MINYREEDVAERVKELTAGQGVEVVLDHVGADFWPAAIGSLAPGGRYGICGVTSGYKAELQLGLMFLRYHTVFGVFMGKTEELRQIVEMAGRGVIKGVIHQTYPLRDAAMAHEAMEGLDFFGKAGAHRAVRQRAAQPLLPRPSAIDCLLYPLTAGSLLGCVPGCRLGPRGSLTTLAIAH